PHDTVLDGIGDATADLVVLLAAQAPDGGRTFVVGLNGAVGGNRHRSSLPMKRIEIGGPETTALAESGTPFRASRRSASRPSARLRRHGGHVRRRCAGRLLRPAS